MVCEIDSNVCQVSVFVEAVVFDDLKLDLFFDV
jgi:hypothetical protein